jgi:hypothetical protein
MRGISKLGEGLLASQRKVCSKELVKSYYVFIAVLLVKAQDPSECGFNRNVKAVFTI